MYSSDQSKKFVEHTKKFLDEGSRPDPSQENTDELIELVKFHEWRYYVKDDPLITDKEFDRLYDLLLEWEEKHPDWKRDWSPTQRVASDLTEEFPTVRHIVPMLSLANSYDEEDLHDFDKTIRKVCELGESEEIKYSVEPKFDGGSISLVYEDDRLKRGATRGNGIEGDDITPNVKVLRSLPLKAPFSDLGIKKAEIRGEALIRKSTFRKVNKRREKEGEPLFANPRNAATGGLRMKDPKETSKRGIEAFLYQWAYAENEQGKPDRVHLQSHSSAMEKLYRLGFNAPMEEMKVCAGIEEVIDYCRKWEEKREDYPWEIDGMVIKVDDIELQQKAGSTSHHPRWAIAYKFKAKQATTKLLNVEYQVGKLGTITPVAKVEPVQLAGVTISSVSLHNEDFIRSKDLRLGDTVLVERAGDVIPYIVKAMKEIRDGSEEKIEFPKYCPINPDKNDKVELVKVGDEAAWRCPVCHCGAQDLQRAIFFVSKSAMDIDGLGQSILERFYEEGWVEDIADIYALDYEKIKALEGWGEKSVENLKKSIENSKDNPLYRLLSGLAIPQLGTRASKLLAERIDHLLDLGEWSEEDFTSIRDIGPVLARNVKEWFSLDRNVEMLKRLEERGVDLSQKEEDRPLKVAEDAPLRDKTILFTGSLQHLTRKEAKEMAERKGARAVSAVSGKLDILVVGENPGSKLDKARGLGSVQIWSETEFLEKIGEA